NEYRPMRDLSNPQQQQQQQPTAGGAGSASMNNNNPRKRKMLLPCVLESSAFDSKNTNFEDNDDDGKKEERGKKEKNNLEKSNAEIFCDKIWDQIKSELVTESAGKECYQARTSTSQCCNINSDRHSPPPLMEVDLLACYSDKIQQELQQTNAYKPAPFKRSRRKDSYNEVLEWLFRDQPGSPPPNSTNLCHTEQQQHFTTSAERQCYNGFGDQHSQQQYKSFQSTTTTTTATSRGRSIESRRTNGMVRMGGGSGAITTPAPTSQHHRFFPRGNSSARSASIDATHATRPSSQQQPLHQQQQRQQQRQQQQQQQRPRNSSLATSAMDDANRFTNRAPMSTSITRNFNENISSISNLSNQIRSRDGRRGDGRTRTKRNAFGQSPTAVNVSHLNPTAEAPQQISREFFEEFRQENPHLFPTEQDTSYDGKFIITFIQILHLLTKLDEIQ
uniref:Uncharacterized protein n=1 Tax=Panagrolaimus sp. ES5 TaxID=591445 RepID=A0AC34G4C1_9BILA